MSDVFVRNKKISDIVPKLFDGRNRSVFMPLGLEVRLGSTAGPVVTS